MDSNQSKLKFFHLRNENSNKHSEKIKKLKLFENNKDLDSSEICKDGKIINYNYTHDTSIKAPIKTCLDLWVNSKSNIKGDSFNINRYRTSYFNIPLVSFMKQKEKAEKNKF